MITDIDRDAMTRAIAAARRESRPQEADRGEVGPSAVEGCRPLRRLLRANRVARSAAIGIDLGLCQYPRGSCAAAPFEGCRVVAVRAISTSGAGAGRAAAASEVKSAPRRAFAHL